MYKNEYKNNRHFLRIFTYLAIIILFLTCIQIKKSKILKIREKKVITFLNEWKTNGKPVYVKKVKPVNLNVIEKITGTTKDGINIKSNISLDLKNKISIGKNFFVVIENKKNNDKQIFYGKVTNISDNVEYKTGMYVVNLKLDKSIKNYLSNNILDFLVCHIIVKELKNIILIPNEIIKRDKNGSFIFKIENGSAVKQYVKLGYDDGAQQVVDEGLNFGDIIVIEGWSILEANDKVEIMKKF